MSLNSSLTWAFLSHEARIQGRSLRYRTAVAAYLVLGSAPAVLVHLRRPGLTYMAGPASYVAEVASFLPLLTALLAALICLDGVTREQSEGAWSTLSLSGISNAGYLLRRWLALSVMILPWTVVPFLVAAGVAAVTFDAALLDPILFAGPWLLHVAPLALLTVTLSFAVGTIASGAINAAVLLFAGLYLIQLALDQTLFRLGLRVGDPLAWIDLDIAMQGPRRIGSGSNSWFQAFPVLASESGIDLRVAAEQHLGDAAYLAALAALALGFAVIYLGRSRPDIRPWKIRPDHPFRTYLQLAARIRERGRPDPRLARADRLAFALALLAAAGFLGLAVTRAREYHLLARERFAAEQAGGPGTSPQVVPERWRVEGRLEESGTVDLRVHAELINQGDEPCGRLSFQLNPDLQVADAGTPGRRLVLKRIWDRLEVELSPPIPARGRGELRFHVTGRPATAAFSMEGGPRSYSIRPFSQVYGQQLRARFAREVVDLSRSYRVPSISRQRVMLEAADLTPVPRYKSWDLADLSVPDETFFPEARLEVSLTVPSGVFLANSCGNLARGGRLGGRCELPVSELAVLGGPHRLLSTNSTDREPAVALFPAHTGPGGPGEVHLGFLRGSSEMIEEAWPGIGSMGEAVVLEWASSRVHDRFFHHYRWDLYPSSRPGFVQLKGNLILLQEDYLSLAKPLQPEFLVAELVTAHLARRRSLHPDDSYLFRQFFRDLALGRLGLGPERGAVLGPMRPGQENIVRIPPPSESYHLYWNQRFPSVVAALERRVGAEGLRLAVDEFLAAAGEEPGRFQELLAAAARHSKAPAERLIQDLFVVGAIPEPVLEEVEFRFANGTWRATGRVHNLGDGEALCRVVLTTDVGAVETMSRADTGQSAPFELTTRHRPQAVLLDPDGDCHRLVRGGGVPRDRVYFQGIQP